MNPSFRFSTGEDTAFRFQGRIVDAFSCRRWREGADGNRYAVLAVLPAAEHPMADTLNRLTHEYGLKDELESAWALRPLELVREGGRTMLMLEAPEGEPLDRFIGPPMELEKIPATRRRVNSRTWPAARTWPYPQGHQAGQCAGQCRDGQVWLTGFGANASRPNRPSSSSERSPRWRLSRPDE
jgi:hypothetical protein